ncbi:MAG: hypothetical protein KGS72_22520 [Cyanobacteria bacterium REEB67]|nr:hypothetical protein [Cyanobacteria bacterium REEB67]
MKKRSLLKVFRRAAYLLGAGVIASATAVGGNWVVLPGSAQNQNLEQLLDKVDPAGAVSLSTLTNSAGSGQTGTNYHGGMPNYSSAVPPGLTPVRPLQRAMQFFGSNGNGRSMPQQNPQAQMQSQNGTGRAGLFKTLFGSDTSGSGDGSDNMYRAENQASIARNACSQSYYGDYYTRSQAADEAYYAASEARREADAASAKAASGAGNAQSNASAARSYADAAEASADTARANADRAWK